MVYAYMIVMVFSSPKFSERELILDTFLQRRPSRFALMLMPSIKDSLKFIAMMAHLPRLVVLVHGSHVTFELDTPCFANRLQLARQSKVNQS